MRLAPAEPRTPAAIDKYLLPREAKLATIRQHPAVLLPSLAAALGGLAVALGVNGIASHNVLSRIVVWAFAAILIGRFGLTLARWMVDYAAITEERFMVVTGTFYRRVQFIAIDDMKQMTFERKFWGRLAGYGTFIIESGINRLVMDCIPYSEQLYLVLSSKVFRQDDDGDGGGVEPVPYPELELDDIIGPEDDEL